jgi:hypothetical protein
MADLRKALMASGYKLVDQRMIQQGRTFIIDDRDSGGIGADGGLLSWFCDMRATVENEDRVLIELGNAPSSSAIDAWLLALDGASSDGGSMKLTVRPGQQAVLAELADLVRAVIKPGARYPVNYWKYSCPRVASGLVRFREALDRAWSGGATPEPEPQRLID